MTPQLDIVIVCWNSWVDLAACLPSVEADLAGIEADLVLVDNASTDGTAQHVARHFPRWKVIHKTHNAGFADANNAGFAATTAPLVLLLNPDTVVEPGCIPQLVDRMQTNPRLGVVGPLKVNADGSLQPSYGRFPTVWEEFLRQSALHRLIPVASPQGPHFTRGQLARMPHDQSVAVDWISCSGLLLRREAAGRRLFQPGEYMYREEVDLCRRVRQAGWEVEFLPQARMLHAMGTSIGRDRARAIRLRLRGEALYFELHGSLFERFGAGAAVVAGSLGRATLFRTLALFATAPAAAELRARSDAYAAAAAERVGLLRDPRGKRLAETIGEPTVTAP